MKRKELGRRTFLKAVGAGAFVASSGVASAKPPATRFKTHPTGDEEVPVPVDTNAQGQANFKLSKSGDELRYKLNAANIDDIIGAHLHQAPAGSNGDVVVSLFGDPIFVPDDDAVTPNGTFVEGTLIAADLIGPLGGMTMSDLVEAMRAGNIYVNVHTIANRAGEIRGQVD